MNRELVHEMTEPDRLAKPFLLDAAVEAARAAGKIIRAGWGQTHTVAMKGPTNPVTEIDHAAEEVIIKILSGATPDFGILSEESPERTGAADARWVIDPLDGTVSYSHHFPYFSVSIALERGGRLEVGVVYDPILDQMFTAERGHGAWLDGKRIQVGNTASLDKSLIATGFPYSIWETGGDIAGLARLTRRVQTLRINGSAALDLAYIACGRLDAYWDSELYPWDLAAGRLLVEEAGGIVELYGGDPTIIESQTMLASNRQLFPLIKSILLPIAP